MGNKRKPLKRANGQGCVYKLPGRRRKPWAARVTVGWNITDEDKLKQQYKIIGYFEQEKEAKEALLKYKYNLLPKKSDITLQQLYDEWSQPKYEHISRSTADNYKAAWKYLSKYADEIFAELRTSHIQQVIDECHKNNMSISTMEKIKAVATMLYDYAMQNDIVDKNYAQFVRLPKVEKAEKKIFTDADIKKMFDNADKVEWVDTILILIYTGMRISEMLLLTKFNVDMEHNVIRGGIKTDAGKDRIIPIHHKILPYVKRWYDKNGERLICNKKGKPLSAKRYRENMYYPALEALDIQKLNPHCCRHTCASLLAKAGADTLAIQKILGHSDYAFTANTYTHTDLEELRKAMELL